MEHKQHTAVSDRPRKRPGTERPDPPERPPLPLTPESPPLPVRIGGQAWFLEAHKPALRLALILVGPEHAEDVAQEAVDKFLRQQLRRGEALPADEAPKRLAAMVRDIARDLRRKLARDARAMQDVSGSTRSVRHWMSTSQSAADGEIRQAIYKVLASVDERDRIAWITVKELEFEVDEVAAAFGRTKKSIWSSVYRANLILREGLSLIGLTPDMLRGRDDS